MRGILAGVLLLGGLTCPCSAQLFSVELSIEAQGRASLVTAPVGYPLVVTLSDDRGRVLLTPVSFPGDRQVELAILDDSAPGSSASRRIVTFGETVDLFVSGVWVRVSAAESMEANLLLFLSKDAMKSRASSTLSYSGSLCCLDSGGGSICGCRVKVGSSCCAEPPCSCGHLY